ncbi:MAG TPA: hypothetical protein VGB74_10855, partial [Actinoplanes sp.]
MLSLTVVVGAVIVVATLHWSMPELAVVVVAAVILTAPFGAVPAPVPVRRVADRLIRTTGSGRPGPARRAREKARRHRPEPARDYLVPVEV